MLKPLEHYLRAHHLVHSGERIGVAVSGGADSVALLRAFTTLAPTLGIVPVVLHLNHQLRTESAADADFVRSLASDLNLECEVESHDVAALASLLHLSLEAAGRRARYAFFHRAAAQLRLDAVATAHTRDDQAETVLLRLLRGTGTSGLAGVHRAFALADLVPDSDSAAEADGESLTPTRLIRPLLAISRQQIETYLRELNQPYRDDLTNRDPRFLRNRVRHELLPSLERDYNPLLRQALCETAEIAAAENDYLDSLVADFFSSSSGPLSIVALTSQPVALQRRILRHLCQSHSLALDFAHLEALRDFALTARAARLTLPRGFVAEVLRPKNGTVSLVLHSPTDDNSNPREYSLTLSVPGRAAVGNLGGTSLMYICASLLGSEKPELAYNRASLLSSARVGHSFLVRNLQPGDRIHILHASRERKVTRLLQELAIPGPLRRRWPVVVSSGRIVWVPGLPPAAEAAWTPGEGSAVVLEIRSGEDSAHDGEHTDTAARTGHL